MARSIFDNFGGQKHPTAAPTPDDNRQPARPEPKPMIRTRASRAGSVFDRLRRRKA